MVEIKDIVDRESLKAWLEGQPWRTSEILTHRAAMRVLPVFLDWAITSKRAKRRGASILPVLRANLTTEVVTYLVPANISPELDFTAIEAGTIALSVAEMAESQMDMFSPDGAFSYTNFFFWGERETRNAEFVANSVLAIEPSMKSYAADSGLIYNGFWNLLRSDISAIMVRFTQNRPALWQDERNPFLDPWKNVKNLLKNSKENWSFWIKWYEAALAGVPLEWEMLEQIALIPSDDWEQGPKHVNGLIAEIEEEFEGKTLEKSEPLVAKPISANNAMVLMTADGMSAQIASVIERYHADTGRNQLPDEFRVLEELPAHFSRFSQLALIGGARDNASFDAEIADLKAKIEALKEDLEIAKSKAVSGVFSKAFLEQAGKSLGDWKLWGALGSAVYYFSSASTVAGTGSSLNSLSEIANSIREMFPIRP